MPTSVHGKGKGLPQEAEEAQGVPGRLRPRIFLTFGITKVVGRQPYASAAFFDTRYRPIILHMPPGSLHRTVVVHLRIQKL